MTQAISSNVQGKDKIQYFMLNRVDNIYSVNSFWQLPRGYSLKSHFDFQLKYYELLMN